MVLTEASGVAVVARFQERDLKGGRNEESKIDLSDHGSTGRSCIDPGLNGRKGGGPVASYRHR